MKKVIVFLLVAFSVFLAPMSYVYSSGHDEQEQTQQTEEKLPETNITNSLKITLGFGIIILAVVTYKIQIDIERIRRDNFEKKILEEFQD